jgi:hypothetical protein
LPSKSLIANRRFFCIAIGFAVGFLIRRRVELLDRGAFSAWRTLAVSFESTTTVATLPATASAAIPIPIAVARSCALALRCTGALFVSYLALVVARRPPTYRHIGASLDMDRSGALRRDHHIELFVVFVFVVRGRRGPAARPIRAGLTTAAASCAFIRRCSLRALALFQIQRPAVELAYRTITACRWAALRPGLA